MLKLLEDFQAVNHQVEIEDEDEVEVEEMVLDTVLYIQDMASDQDNIQEEADDNRQFKEVPERSYLLIYPFYNSPFLLLPKHYLIVTFIFCLRFM